MSIEKLKQDLQEAVTDDFEVGTVIRWTVAGRYTYAAIKTAIGWSTTSRDGNPFVARQLEYADLVEILSRTEVSEVMVATEREPIR